MTAGAQWMIQSVNARKRVQGRSHCCGDVGIEAVKEWDECLHTPGKVIKRQYVVLTPSYRRSLLVFAASET